MKRILSSSIQPTACHGGRASCWSFCMSCIWEQNHVVLDQDLFLAHLIPPEPHIVSRSSSSIEEEWDLSRAFRSCDAVWFSAGLLL